MRHILGYQFEKHNFYKVFLSVVKYVWLGFMVILLLLLLSRFSCVRLCVTHRQQPTRLPPSLGFSRQEHWSGLPFPSPMLYGKISDPEIVYVKVVGQIISIEVKNKMSRISFTLFAYLLGNVYAIILSGKRKDIKLNIQYDINYIYI